MTKVGRLKLGPFLKTRMNHLISALDKIEIEGEKGISFIAY